MRCVHTFDLGIPAPLAEDAFRAFLRETSTGVDRLLALFAEEPSKGRFLLHAVAGEERFDSLVLVSEADLEVLDRLSGAGKTEVPRFDDPGVDGTHRHLVDPLAPHEEEPVAATRIGCGRTRGPQREELLRPRLVEAQGVDRKSVV